MGYSIIEENGRFFKYDNDTGMNLGELSLADAVADSTTNKEMDVLAYALLQTIGQPITTNVDSSLSALQLSINNVYDFVTRIYNDGSSYWRAMRQYMSEDLIPILAGINTLNSNFNSVFVSNLMALLQSINDGVNATATAFANHIETDLGRWQDVANLRAEFYSLKSSIENKVLDTANVVDIETQAQGADGYTVASPLGGLINFTTIAVLVSPGTLSVNGVRVWSASGLSLLQEIKDAYEVEDGDVVTCTGMTSITFTPYINS